MANNNKTSVYTRSQLHTELANRRENDAPTVSVEPTPKVDSAIDEVVSTSQKFTLREIAEQERTKRNYNLGCRYAMLMDALNSYISDIKNPNVTGELPALGSIGEDDLYYSTRMTPEQLEYFALGDLAKVSKIKDQLWEGVRELAKHPKGADMYTSTGSFTGQPIIVTIEKDPTTDRNRYNGVISNLKNQGASGPIKYVNIFFFRPLFRDFLEDEGNFVILPRNLQANIEYKKITNPDLFNVRRDGKVTPLDTNVVRKYFLYVASRNNRKGNIMNIEAIKFFNCVMPSQVNSYKGAYYLRDWFLCKKIMDTFFSIHSALVRDGVLYGINFTTQKSYYDKDAKKFLVWVSREQPLQEQPAFVASDTEERITIEEQDIEIEDAESRSDVFFYDYSGEPVFSCNDNPMIYNSNEQDTADDDSKEPQKIEAKQDTEGDDVPF